MRLIACGYSNPQIARRLFVSEGTVRKHLENICAKQRSALLQVSRLGARR